MIAIEAEVRKSIRHGRGLYAMQDIPKDTVVYFFNPDIDDTMLLNDASDEDRHFGYACRTRPKILSICGDMARFWNFPNPDEAANCVESDIMLFGEPIVVATNGIMAGEELLICPLTDLLYESKVRNL
jgi:hypothetical protein